jgi:hypothetical protein
MHLQHHQGKRGAPDLNRIIIKIDLTADGSSDARDIIHFDKPRAVGISDDGSSIDTAPQDVIATSAAKNRSGGDSDGGRSL